MGEASIKAETMIANYSTLHDRGSGALRTVIDGYVYNSADIAVIAANSLLILQRTILLYIFQSKRTS